MLNDARFKAAPGTRRKAFLEYLFDKVLWDSKTHQTRKWKKLGNQEKCVRAAFMTLFWLTSVLASFLIVYIKLTVDVFLSALANLGVCWARRLTTYTENTKLGKFLALSNQSKTQQKFMKLIEQLVEALPQLIIALIYCFRHWVYIWLTEVDRESWLPLPSSLISPIFSVVSLIMGIYNGVTAYREMTNQRALVLAAGNGDKREVERLIGLLQKSDLNLDYINSGFSALMKASENGHYDCIKLLLAQDASINLQSTGRTALIWASREGHSACVKLLLDEGANTDLQDSGGSTALIQASLFGHPACVELLLGAGANTDLKTKKSNTALMKAREKGHQDCIQLLLTVQAK